MRTRRAPPGPLAPAAERVALAHYRQSGDQDDAVAVALETVAGEGGDTLTGDAGADDVAEARPVGGITFGPEDVGRNTDQGGVRIVDPFDPSGQDHLVAHEQIDDLEARADDLRASNGAISPELKEEIGLLVLSVLPGTG